MMAEAQATALSVRVREWMLQLQFHAAAIGVIALAVLVLGWSGVFPWLVSLGPDYPSMKAVTAASLIVLCAACLISLRPGKLAIRVAAALGLAVALWMAVQLFFGVGRPDTGVWSLASSHATQASLMIGGLAFALLPFSPSGMSAVVFALAVGVTGAALFRAFDLVLLGGVVLGHSPFDSMAVHTALLIAWLSVACILLHPRLGVRDVLLRASLRGRMMRYALLLILALPFVSYGLAWVLSRLTGWTDNSLFATTASLSVVGGAMLVWWYSALVERLMARTVAHVAELTRANEALERYASMMAHDLKAPIRHIRVYSELAAEMIGAGETEKAVEYSMNNIDSCNALLASADSLLLHARSSYTQLNLDEHRLSELLRSSKKILQEDAARVRAAISVGNDVVLTCDGFLMASVFQNLMANSINNCDPNQPLRINVNAVREGEVWRIAFEDNGPGFDADFISKAFDHLARGAPERSDGAGIGLTICKTIMENHGGSIAIDGAFKQGARILLTLPVKPELRPARRDWVANSD